MAVITKAHLADWFVLDPREPQIIPPGEMRGTSGPADGVGMNRYPNISDHGLIGDLQTAALVTTDGTLDWFCCPGSTRPASSRPCWMPSAAVITGSPRIGTIT